MTDTMIETYEEWFNKSKFARYPEVKQLLEAAKKARDYFEPKSILGKNNVLEHSVLSELNDAIALFE